MRVERTRNSGTMTEAEYWGAIRSALRRRWRGWRPLVAAMLAARRPKTKASGPGKHRFEYRCALCRKWWKHAEVRADHVEPVGSLNCLEDLPDFVRRLTPEDPKAFQCLCIPCHKAKTVEDRRLIRERRSATNRPTGEGPSGSSE